jgi:hypothetical protein
VSERERERVRELERVITLNSMVPVVDKRRTGMELMVDDTGPSSGSSSSSESG